MWHTPQAKRTPRTEKNWHEVRPCVTPRSPSLHSILNREKRYIARSYIQMNNMAQALQWIQKAKSLAGTSVQATTLMTYIRYGAHTNCLFVGPYDFVLLNRTKLHLRQEQDVFEDIKALPKVLFCSVDATNCSTFLTRLFFRRRAFLTNFGYAHVWIRFQYNPSTHELCAPTQHRLSFLKRPARFITQRTIGSLRSKLITRPLHHSQLDQTQVCISALEHLLDMPDSGPVDKVHSKSTILTSTTKTQGST
jgi:hypothetical protein